MAELEKNSQVWLESIALSEQQIALNNQFRIQSAIKLLVDVLLKQCDIEASVDLSLPASKSTKSSSSQSDENLNF